MIFLNYLFNYLFWVALGPCCFTRASSSCESGLLSACGSRASHCSDFSCCRAQALGHAGSVVVVCRLSGSKGRGIFLD